MPSRGAQSISLSGSCQFFVYLIRRQGEPKPERGVRAHVTLSVPAVLLSVASPPSRFSLFLGYHMFAFFPVPPVLLALASGFGVSNAFSWQTPACPSHPRVALPACLLPSAPPPSLSPASFSKPHLLPYVPPPFISPSSPSPASFPKPPCSPWRFLCDQLSQRQYHFSWCRDKTADKNRLGRGVSRWKISSPSWQGKRGRIEMQLLLCV